MVTLKTTDQKRPDLCHGPLRQKRLCSIRYEAGIVKVASCAFTKPSKVIFKLIPF